MTKMQNAKEMFGSSAYPELLSTLSINDVMVLEFQMASHTKWECMVLCKEQNKKMYLCNVCNVYQYGDKNLFSHLAGRKHIFKMEIVKNIRLPKEIVNKNTKKSNPNAQVTTVPKNIAQPADSIKNINKSITTTQPKKLPIGSTAKPKEAKPQVAPTIKPNSANPSVASTSKPVATKAPTKSVTTNSSVASTTKPILTKTLVVKGPVKTMASNPSVATTSKPNAANLPVGSSSKSIAVKPPVNQLETNSSVVTTLNSTTPKASLEPSKSNAKPPVYVTSKPTAIQPSVESNADLLVTKSQVELTPKPIATKSQAAGILKKVAAKPQVELTSSTNAAKPQMKSSAMTNATETSTTSIANSQESITKSKLPDEAKDMGSNQIEISEVTDDKTSSNNPKEGNTSSLVQKNEDKSTASTVIILDDVDITTPRKETNFSDNDRTDNLENSAQKEKNTEYKVTKRPIKLNLVKNPAKVAALAAEKKISCVPLSKLIIAPTNKEVSQKIAKVVDSNYKDEVILLDSEINASSSTAQENNKCVEKIITPTSMDVNHKPPSTITFDDSKNMTEILGLIGVEYVIKIVRAVSDLSPRFLCSLCNITADEISMHNHLISINHRLKYCEEHFPTAIRQYRQQISHIPEHQVFKVLTPILNKLAIAIETHHGRENAYHCYEYWFNKNKKSVLSTVFHRRHASEQTGPIFTHVVDSNEVEMFIEHAHNKIEPPLGGIIRLANNEPPHRNSFNNSNNVFRNQQQPNRNYTNNYLPQSNVQPKNIETVDDETHKRMVENFLRDTRHSQPSSRHRHAARPSKRNRSRSLTPDRKRKRTSPLLASQWNVERKSLSPLRDGDIWQAYRHMVDHSVRELNTAFEMYKSDPEEHPSYKDEWQKFWKRRKDELIASGINHRTYNYQNEWILFFNARLEELYNQDLENIKIKCRERLCLPMMNNELTDTKYHVNIADDLPEAEPLQEQLIDSYVDKQLKPVDYLREPSPKHKLNPREKREEVNVIHVLRLLTALEDYLGSLGPSITELLAKALQISKVHPDKVNSLILTNENCVILETAKEKFTGLIISKMLEPNQERALKKAVNDTEDLLEFASALTTQCPNKNMESDDSTTGQALGNSDSNQEVVQKTKSYKISDQIDKSELAAKLASSLISQGKAKIHPEQLKQIIQVYSLIEQKKLQESSSTSRSSANNSLNVASSSQNNEQFSTEQQSFNSNPTVQNRESYNINSDLQNSESYNKNSALQNYESYELNSLTGSRESYNLDSAPQGRALYNSHSAALNRQPYDSSTAAQNRESFNSRSASKNPELYNSNAAARNNQSYNSNPTHDRYTFINRNQIPANMTSDKNDMKTSSNYFSANMAQTNNTNLNKNSYGIPMEYTSRNLPDSHGNRHNGQFLDSGQFTNNRNPSSSMHLNRTYPFGSTNDNSGVRRNWM